MGRFHLLLLHLPIGLIFANVIIELLISKNRTINREKLLGNLLWTWNISTVLAALTGVLLGNTGGYDDNLLENHQYTGIALAVISWVTSILHFVFMNKKTNVWLNAYRTALALSFLLTFIVGHLGGTLTHGESFLFPDEEIEEANQFTTSPTIIGKSNLPPSVYQSKIKPIFKANCLKCHGPSKQKGDYRIDNKTIAIQGGDSGRVAIIPGNAADSELVKRLLKDRPEKKAMPPKEKKALTKAQIDLIIKWINDGAKWADETIASSPKKTVVAVDKLYNITKQDIDKLSFIRKANGIVEATKWDIGGLMINLKYVPQNKFEPILEQLLPLADKIVWLDLSRKQLSAEQVKLFKNFKNLVRLHLSETNLVNDDLSELLELKKIEYLNLNHTKVTKNGLIYLKPLKHLKKIYLWDK